MIPTKQGLLFSLVFLIFVTTGFGQSAEDELKYQDRGDRWEGIVLPKKSGNDLELVSAMVEYQESTSVIPEKVAIRFYLKDRVQTSIAVRGVRVSQDYWMNKVRPPKEWQQGFGNEFSWKTGDVIQKLKAVKSIYDLGVVARLGQELEVTDAVEERVAPVIFYYSKLPTTVAGYRFTFKPITYETLRCDFYQEVNGVAEGNSVLSQVYPNVEPGIPFNVEWDSSTATDGWYQLKVTGIKRYSKEPVDKIVHFYHSRRVGR